MGGHYICSSETARERPQVVVEATNAATTQKAATGTTTAADELNAIATVRFDHGRRGLGRHCRRHCSLLDNKSATNDNSSGQADQWPFVALESAASFSRLVPAHHNFAGNAAASAGHHRGRRLRFDETNQTTATATNETSATAAALWPAVTVGRCSTFAAADVRRAIRVGVTRQREQQQQQQQHLARWCKLVAPAGNGQFDPANGKQPHSVKFKCNPSIVGRRLQLNISHKNGRANSADDDDEDDDGQQRQKQQQAERGIDHQDGRHQLDCMQQRQRQQELLAEQQRERVACSMSLGHLNYFGIEAASSSTGAARASERQPERRREGNKSENILSTWTSLVGGARDEQEEVGDNNNSCNNKTRTPSDNAATCSSDGQEHSLQESNLNANCRFSFDFSLIDSPSSKRHRATVNEQSRREKTQARGQPASLPTATVSMHSVQPIHHASPMNINLHHNIQDLVGQPSSSGCVNQPHHLSASSKQLSGNMNNNHHSIVSLSSLSSSNGNNNNNNNKQKQPNISLIGGSSSGSIASMASINGLGGAPGGGANQSAANKLGRLVGKKASRVKELLLQNLGRAERTTDELFDLYEENFHKQQQQAQRMAKEFKNYAQSLRQFHDSSKSLSNFLKQSTGNYVTARHDLICDNLSQIELLNEELLEKMREQILANMENYLDQFGELKEKIAKRHRKLTDFDSSKRAFNLMLNQVNKRRIRVQQQQQSLGEPASTNNESSSASQLVDEARLLKMREQFNYCRLMYETINSELHDELPIVYEKKMKILWTMLRNYFALEARYHSQAGKLMATASDVIDESPEMLLMPGDNNSSSSLINNKRQLQHPQQQQQKVIAYSDSDAIVGGSGQTQVTDGGQTSGDESGRSGAGGHKVGSSGVGSSRGDSSCLDTSSSSSSSSPDMRQRGAANEDDEDDGRESMGEQEQQQQQQQQADENTNSGKELEPVDLVDGEETTAELKEQPREGPEEEEAESAGARVPTVGVVGESVVGPAAAQPEETATERNDEEQEPRGEANGDDPSQMEEIKLDAETNVPNLDKLEQIVTSKMSHIGCDDDDDDDEKVNVIDCSNQLACGEQQSRTNEADEDVCLYKVKTNYKYLAEDVDELCFEADEIIQVIEFDESHEPEDGWLMGVREVNGQRGLFPANFTRPI